MRGAWAVIVLDLKRFWIDRARLIAGLAQPLLYLFVLGAGLGANSQQGRSTYSPFIFPGVIALSLLFTATFAAIVIVFDRQMGFFKAVLVAPVSRASIACGKIASGAIQAFVQGLIVLPFAPFAGVPLSVTGVVLLLGAMMLSAATFSAIGVAVASRFTSVTVFPIVSNALLLPMFFLSGALYDLKNTPHWMQIAAACDPVAHGVDLMRWALIGKHFFNGHLFPGDLSIGIMVAVIVVLAMDSVRIFKRGEDDNLTGAAKLGRFR